MNTENLPSIASLIQVIPVKSPGEFMSMMITYLSTLPYDAEQVMRDFANPSSALFRHLFEIMKSAPFWEEKHVGMSDDDRRVVFYREMVKPLKAAMEFGERTMIMGMKKVRPFPLDDSPKTEETIVPQKEQPIKPPMPTPNPPRSVIVPNNVPSPSTNTLYMSQLPDGVNANLDMMIRTLYEVLDFPSDLCHAQLRLRVGKHNNTCFLQGPRDDPEWAKKMIEAKPPPTSRLYDSKIHMDYAKPRRQVSSPGRPQKVAELATRLARVGIKSPPPLSKAPKTPDPSNQSSSNHHEGDNQQSKKRPMEGRQRLVFENDKDKMDTRSSPEGMRSPSLKHMNTQPTPSFVRHAKDTLSQEKNEGKYVLHLMMSPRIKGGEATVDKTYKEALAQNTPKRGNEHQMDFDDALPTEGGGNK